MSVNELQALTQQFADAFDQRDLKPVMEMLSEDVEVFDHVPYRFDGKPLFAKYLNEAFAGIVSASFGFRQPSCRVYGDTVGIVNAYDMFTGVIKDGKVRSIHGRTTLVFIKQERAVEDCQRPLLRYAPGSLKMRPGHAATWRWTMTIRNPLADNSPDHEDQSLVLRARSGDRQALEDLVQRHQAWIYNIAVRMLHHPQDAEDATQEILIKVLTRLSSFEGRSSFRTWLYRIVVNHVLNMKRGRVEQASLDFAFYGAALDNTPELELGFEYRRVLSLQRKWRPHYAPKLKKRTALFEKLREIFRTHLSWPVETVIAKINPILRGWVNYFRVGHSSICLGVVKRWVEEKVRRHLMRARGRKGFGWTRWSSEWLYDRLGLFNDYQLRRWSGAKVAPAR